MSKTCRICKYWIEKPVIQRDSVLGICKSKNTLNKLTVYTQDADDRWNELIHHEHDLFTAEDFGCKYFDPKDL